MTGSSRLNEGIRLSNRLRWALYLACAAGAVAMAPGAGFAQEQEDGTEEPTEEIVIYGQALSLQRSVDAKRNATTHVNKWYIAQWDDENVVI